MATTESSDHLPTQTVELSIIVAASNSQRTLPECLTTVQKQIDSDSVELMVAANPADARLVREKFPDVRIIESERPRLIPELWGRAIAQARGRVIALTVASCIPDARWVEQILRAHQNDYAAVGGAIESAAGANLVDWAVYFVRYTPFMLPFQAGPVIEVPGDNGSYKRDAIKEQMAAIAARGFWETEINARLRAQKQTLWRNPRVIVYHKKSFTFAGFTRQRFEHGRIFGRTRAAHSSLAKRAFYILASPAIPFAFLARILRNLARRRRHLLPFVISFPLTFWFLLCWAAGELLGLLGG